MTEPEGMNEYGSRVREARERLGYSQKALAEMTGLARQTIANIEANRTVPRVQVARLLNSVLGIGDGPATAEAVIFNVLGDYSSDLDWIDEVGAKLVAAMREAGLLR